MKKPTFSYPDQPPSWLDQWPAKIEIDRQFSLGIRNTARMIGSRESIQRLEWTDSTLELILGVQRPVWRFDGRDWHRSCTCGYPEAACVHCWLAAYLFQTVCQVEEWFPKGESTESSSDESFEKKGSGRSPPLQSENGEWPRRASWHAPAPTAPPPAPAAAQTQ